MYLAVWQDSRNASMTGTDIFATRIAVDGTVLDPGGVVISNASGNQTAPKVASNGDDFFVIWAEGDRLAGTRVGHDGSALNAGTRIELPGRTNQRSHAVGRSGNNYVLVRAAPFDWCSPYDDCFPSFHADVFRGSDMQIVSSKRIYKAGEWAYMDTFDVVIVSITSSIHTSRSNLCLRQTGVTTTSP